MEINSFVHKELWIESELWIEKWREDQRELCYFEHVSLNYSDKPQNTS